MPPRKRAPAGPPGLTDGDVADLRWRLGAGDSPRVVVRAASAAVPAGTRGTVVRMGNPADGEFIVVRLGRDEVPFAPSELGLTGKAGKAAAAKAAAAPATPSPRKTAGKTAAKSAKAAPAKAPSRSSAKAVAAPTPAAAAAPVSRTRKASASRKPRSRKALPSLVVTLRFNDGGWTVEASRGARRVSKASPVRPGAVKAFADLVDEPAVRDALTETIESCRSVVEERAAALRVELHAAEAALKDYDARRR